MASPTGGRSSARMNAVPFGIVRLVDEELALGTTGALLKSDSPDTTIAPERFSDMNFPSGVFSGTSFPFLTTTVNNAERVMPAVAEMVALPAPDPVTVNVPLVAPAGNVIAALETCATPVLLDARSTTRPFCGA